MTFWLDGAMARVVRPIPGSESTGSQSAADVHLRLQTVASVNVPQAANTQSADASPRTARSRHPPLTALSRDGDQLAPRSPDTHTPVRVAAYSLRL